MSGGEATGGGVSGGGASGGGETSGDEAWGVLPDGDLEPELAGFARQVRGFCARALAPYARAVDEERRFRHETVAELAGAGLLAGPLPAEHGGGGWSAMQVAVAHEELGAVCGNARGFAAVQSGLVATTLARHGGEAVRRRWLGKLLDGTAIGCFALTEPEAGSDVASLRCRAERIDGGWRLHGDKIWITNGGIADVALVFAKAGGDGREAITGFVVETDRAGFARDPMPGIELGHRGSDHARLHLDGVAVDDTAVLGEVGAGFAQAMDGLHAGRLSVAAGAVGIHRAALAASIAFVSVRRQFGKPLAAFQMVQERIADTLAELLAARALVHRCARRRDAGTEHAGDLAVAKLVATEAAAAAADRAVMLHGGRGYASDHVPERLLRDASGLRIYEGTSMVQKAILARAVLRPER